MIKYIICNNLHFTFNQLKSSQFDELFMIFECSFFDNLKFNNILLFSYFNNPLLC